MGIPLLPPKCSMQARAWLLERDAVLPQHHCSATLALQLLVPWLLLHLELSRGSEQSFLSPVVL